MDEGQPRAKKTDIIRAATATVGGWKKTAIQPFARYDLDERVTSVMFMKFLTQQQQQNQKKQTYFG